jgi:hypothetical protein
MKETLITNLTWGNIEVRIDGKQHVFKDCKLWPGGGREWKWGETGTHHSPGIQPADVEEILTHRVDAIILTHGQLGRLGVTDETKALLAEKGIQVHVANTIKAVDLFNRLTKQGKRVGGLFHSTC